VQNDYSPGRNTNILQHYLAIISINIITSLCGKNSQVWPDPFPNFLEGVGLVSNSQYFELNR